MKRFRDENGKLTILLKELHEATHEEAIKYFTPGSIFLNMADGEEYVLAPITEQLAQFDSFGGKHLFIPTENLGSFLPDVASEGMELVKQIY